MKLAILILVAGCANAQNILQSIISSHPASVSIALVSHTAAASTNTLSITTSAIDTTLANFIVIGGAGYTANTPVISDSKSNTWNALTTYTGSGLGTTIYYCFPCTVGSGHTFTSSAGAGIYPAIAVSAWSGVASSPFDVQNGNTATSASTLQTGSVTPSANGELLITAFGVNSTGTYSIDSGFTVLDSTAYSGTAFGVAVAYLIQSVAASKNPTWSLGTSTAMSAAIATFK